VRLRNREAAEITVELCGDYVRPRKLRGRVVASWLRAYTHAAGATVRHRGSHGTYSGLCDDDPHKLRCRSRSSSQSQPKPNQTTPNDANPNQAKSNPNQDKPNEANPNQANRHCVLPCYCRVIAMLSPRQQHGNNVVNMIIAWQYRGNSMAITCHVMAMLLPC
jgi:hypothetical protein